MMSPTTIASPPAGELAPQRGVELAIVADHAVDLGHRGIALGLDLGAAAGDDDAGSRLLAPRPADRLARLALGLGGHRAGVHDHRVLEARGRGMAAHHLGFEAVQPAAEGHDHAYSWGAAHDEAASRSGCRRPS